MSGMMPLLVSSGFYSPTGSTRESIWYLNYHLSTDLFYRSAHEGAAGVRGHASHSPECDDGQERALTDSARARGAVHAPTACYVVRAMDEDARVIDMVTSNSDPACPTTGKHASRAAHVRRHGGVRVSRSDAAS